jgi:transcriptional regulator with XRE-family HTH domain
MRQLPPEPWASAMIVAGFVWAGDPSYGQLAERAGVTKETVRQLALGGRVPDTDTIEKVARALGVDVLTVSQWANQARSVRKSYEVPREADLLTEEEQRAITALIRAIAKTRREGEEHGSNGSTTIGTSNVRQLPPPPPVLPKGKAARKPPVEE